MKKTRGMSASGMARSRGLRDVIRNLSFILGSAFLHGPHAEADPRLSFHHLEISVKRESVFLHNFSPSPGRHSLDDLGQVPIPQPITMARKMECTDWSGLSTQLQRHHKTWVGVGPLKSRCNDQKREEQAPLGNGLKVGRLRRT